MKATHRLKTNHGQMYFDVGSDVDQNGFVSVKLVSENYWLNTTVHFDAIEPIPAPAPRRPFDYESWRALLKQHGGNVWVRPTEKGKQGPHFSGVDFLDYFEREPGKSVHYSYSTDFGDTWHEMSRE